MLQSFPNRIQFQCSLHRSQLCTHLCTDASCASTPFLCGLCMAQLNTTHHSHEEHITLFDEGVVSLSKMLENNRGQFERLHASQNGNPQTDSVESTHALLDSQINNFKSKVDKILQSLVTEFNKRVNAAKQGLYAEIDRYKKSKLASLQVQKDSTSPVSAFNSQYKYYINPSTLLLKLKTQHKKKSFLWFTSLRRFLSKAQTLLGAPSESHRSVPEISPNQEIGYCYQDLPQSCNAKLQELINACMKDLIVVKNLKQTESHIRSKYRNQ